ncbi:MAG: dTMP kinase, partial [Myxococcaceae bacterium]
LRPRLYAQAPAAVLEGLKRQDAPEAWALRERGMRDGHLGAVLLGLAGVDGEESWVVREAGMQRKLYSEVARSLGGLATERADALREVLLKHDRLAVLKSTTGLETPLALGLREQLEKGALKLVLRSLTGVDSPRAWELRERGALQTKEALDSVDGMDDPRAWKLRASAARRWPATVVSSMRGLPLVAETRALLERVLSEQDGKLPVLRNAYAVVAQARALEQAGRAARPGVEPAAADMGRQEA